MKRIIAGLLISLVGCVSAAEHAAPRQVPVYDAAVVQEAAAFFAATERPQRFTAARDIHTLFDLLEARAMLLDQYKAAEALGQQAACEELLGNETLDSIDAAQLTDDEFNEIDEALTAQVQSEHVMQQAWIKVLARFLLAINNQQLFERYVGLIARHYGVERNVVEQLFTWIYQQTPDAWNQLGNSMPANNAAFAQLCEQVAPAAVLGQAIVAVLQQDLNQKATMDEVERLVRLGASVYEPIRWNGQTGNVSVLVWITLACLQDLKMYDCFETVVRAAAKQPNIQEMEHVLEIIVHGAGPFDLRVKPLIHHVIMNWGTLLKEHSELNVLKIAHKNALLEKFEYLAQELDAARLLTAKVRQDIGLDPQKDNNYYTILDRYRLKIRVIKSSVQAVTGTALTFGAGFLLWKLYNYIKK